MPAPKDTATAPRPILVAVNFSSACEAALVEGAHRAERAQAPMLIVHIVHEHGNNIGFYLRRDANDVRPISAIAEEMFDDFLRRAIATHPGAKAIAQAERKIASGIPCSRILELARWIGSQEILVGSRSGSQGFLAGLLCGSIGTWLERHSDIPVRRVVPTAARKAEIPAPPSAAISV